MRKTTKTIGTVTLSIAMLLASMPMNVRDARAAADYVYDDAYSLGWFIDKNKEEADESYEGEIAVYNGGKTYKTVEEAGIPVYDGKDDNPFKPEKKQAWNAEKLTLTRPVQYTTEDGKVHNVEGMLTGFDFIADPTAIDNSKYDGKLYVYGTTEGFSYSNDTMKKNEYDNHSLTILSSTDMVNWTDEGFMDSNNLENDRSDWGAPVKSWTEHSWAPSGLAFDGDKDGKDEYYIFYTSGGSVGYVMSESPTGPWRSPLTTSLFGGWNGVVKVDGVKWCFDPAVLRDNKGNAYVYFGGGIWDSESEMASHPDGIARPKTGRVCKLKFNANGEAEADGEPQEMNTYYFYEDSEINQFNDKYYYSYCTNFKVPADDKLVTKGSIAVYVSSDPMNIAFDPYESGSENVKPKDGNTYHHFLGTILDNPSTIYGQFYNNHHHMQEFKGHMYILYHSTELNNALHHVSNEYRNLHVDEITVNKETDAIDGMGELDTKTNTHQVATYEGPKQVGTFNLYNNIATGEDGKDKVTDKKMINATTTSYSAGVKSERSDRMVDSVYSEDDINNGSPMVLSEIDTGDWVKIQGADLGNGIKSFEAVLASETNEGAVELFIDDPCKASNMIGKLSVKKTDDIEDYQKVTASDIDSTVTGVHDLYFVFRGSDYRVSSWNFVENEQAPATATPNQTDAPKATDVPAVPTAAAVPTATAVSATNAPAEVTSAPQIETVDTSKTYTVGKNIYKITDAAAKTADYAGPAKKTVKTAVIPATVNIEGNTYKVTGVASGAFKGCTALTKVTVGKNVKSIGAAAFSGCKKLKTIVVKTSVLKKVGAKALSGIAAKAQIKVPKSKLKAYKKLFKGKGQGKKVKIK